MIFESGLATLNEVKGDASQRQNENVGSFKKNHEGHFGSPGGPRGKESTCQYRNKRPEFNPWIREISQGRKWPPTPLILVGKSHGQRSLVGYSLWGHLLDTTKWLRSQSMGTQEVVSVCVCVCTRVCVFMCMFMHRHQNGGIKWDVIHGKLKRVDMGRTWI